MADTSTLKEYLIDLGFRVKEPEYRKFLDKTESVDKVFRSLAIGFAGAAAALGAFTARAAEQFAALHYESQRTGAAVGNLESLEAGFKAVGVSAEKAHAFVGSLVERLKLNPGLADWFKRLGISGDTPSTMLLDVIRKFGEVNRTKPWQAEALASEAGVDYQSAVQLSANLPAVLQAMTEFTERQRAAGVDPEKMAKNAAEFQTQWARLTSNLQILAEVLAAPLIPSFTRLAAAVNDIVSWWLFARSRTEHSRDIAAHEARRMLFNQVIPGAGDWLFGKPVAQEAPEVPAQGTVPRTPAGVMDYFEKLGYSHQAAAGLAANLKAESPTLNPKETGDGGRAFGIAQWHPDRQRRFEEVFKIPIQRSTFEQQLGFVHWELQHQESKAGEALRQPGITARMAGAITSMLYERPADVRGQAAMRGSLAEQFARGIASIAASAGEAVRQGILAKRIGSNLASLRTPSAYLSPAGTAQLAPAGGAPSYAVNYKVDIHGVSKVDRDAVDSLERSLRDYTQQTLFRQFAPMAR